MEHFIKVKVVLLFFLSYAQCSVINDKKWAIILGTVKNINKKCNKISLINHLSKLLCYVKSKIQDVLQILSNS